MSNVRLAMPVGVISGSRHKGDATPNASGCAGVNSGVGYSCGFCAGSAYLTGVDALDVSAEFPAFSIDILVV